MIKYIKNINKLISISVSKVPFLMILNPLFWWKNINQFLFSIKTIFFQKFHFDSLIKCHVTTSVKWQIVLNYLQSTRILKVMVVVL